MGFEFEFSKKGSLKIQIYLMFWNDFDTLMKHFS